jgi:hypothetical protein
MKKTQPDLDRTCRRAIEARLQRPATDRERQWVDEVSATYAEHFGCVPDRAETRRLFWELELGLDRHWPIPRPEDEDHPGWRALCAQTTAVAG